MIEASYIQDGRMIYEEWNVSPEIAKERARALIKLKSIEMISLARKGNSYRIMYICKRRK